MSALSRRFLSILVSSTVAVAGVGCSGDTSDTGPADEAGARDTHDAGGGGDGQREPTRDAVADGRNEGGADAGSSDAGASDATVKNDAAVDAGLVDVEFGAAPVGWGTIKSTDFDCTSCSRGYAPGTVVTVVAMPKPGKAFREWGQLCKGQGAACTFTVPTPTTGRIQLIAVFEDAAPADAGTVEIAFGGAPLGAGSVKSATFECDSCKRAYAPGTHVAVTAVARLGKKFSAWGGLCAGQPVDCTFTVPSTSTAESAIAVFHDDPASDGGSP